MGYPLGPHEVGITSAECQTALDNLVLLIWVKHWVSDQLLKVLRKQFHATFIFIPQPKIILGLA